MISKRYLWIIIIKGYECVGMRQEMYQCGKKIMKVSKSLKVFYEIVDWEYYVYFQLKSLTKSITQKSIKIYILLNTKRHFIS